MDISRRLFLLSSAAALLSPVARAAPVGLPAGAAARLAPATTIWICGTPGEYDWHPFDAPTREEAWRKFCRRIGVDENSPVSDECVDRAAGFDGMLPEDIRAADWIENGLGACCDRCGCETHGGAGGQVIECEAVCEDCLTLAERIEIDREGVLNDIICDISNDGEEDVRERFVKREEWDDIPSDLWAEAVSAAALEGK